MKRRTFAKGLALGMSACVCLAGTVWASAPEAKDDAAAAAVEEAVDKAVEEATDELAAVVDKAVDEVIDEALADSFKLSVTNKTGKDIEFFSVYEVGSDEDPDQLITMIQEALIGLEFLDDVADGSFGPKSQAALELFLEENNLSGKTIEDEEVLEALFGEYDDGNLLEEGKPLKNDESTDFIILPEAKAEAAEAEDAAAEEAADAAEDAAVEFRALVRLAGDEDKEYTIHVLPAEDAELSIMISTDDVIYIEYTTKDSKEPVSTLDEEMTFHDADQARAEYSNFATYGDDGGYGDYGDYSYSAPAADYSYSAPAAPAYEDTSWINAAQGADDCADLGAMGATW